ncbi:hypothetical protein KO504_16930 [Winogradskyella psychrotolerans]|uniref:hypothetical protein n=1 Tax=Winogradskyella psychrotolerans TaxID=1344585 RepID=UPI001C06E555|nr:hypothetical protein [Winogradskyella psychrotolerans]MBU2923036.1 hypothetical protein [Winogradskyella psychrotolerans]
MKPTNYYHSKAALTKAAQLHSAISSKHWFIRTKLPCNHDVFANKKAVLLLEGNTLVQRLVQCNTCNQYYKEGGSNG